ncbi:methyltransferase domain-containing protein [Patescibacteria group bacterium]|nr:methyltransferase domain-containing protein [Patescibacteria group bacterium]
MTHPSRQPSSQSSWQPVHGWYNELVGEKGHYYHQHVILPKTVQLLAMKEGTSLLDLACGQGVLARALPAGVEYWGVDASRALIEAAQQHDDSPDHHFAVADLTRSTFPIEKKDFTHASIILALQNIRTPRQVFRHAVEHLVSGGKFLVVLNHPCFRIPRQSSWGVDESKKTQYRRIDRYLSPLEIPIQAHPGKAQRSPMTWSFHFPLSTYLNELSDTGFVITRFEEWSSDKTSEGKAAKMENRSRSEFPLFAAILAEKR